MHSNQDAKQEVKKEGVIEKIIAPLFILKTEKMYGCWAFVLIISYLGIMINWLNNLLDSCFQTGSFYSTGVTIIAPLCMELIIQNQVRNRKNEKLNFSSYHSPVLVISILYIIIALVLQGSNKRSDYKIQIGFTIVSILFSFYAYFVSKMEDHPKALSDYKDKTYAEMEKATVADLNSQATTMTSTQLDDGEVMDL